MRWQCFSPNWTEYEQAKAYRMIFNQKRGLLMTVAETVASQGRSKGTAVYPFKVRAHGFPLKRLIAFSVAIAALFGSVNLVQAQIIALLHAGAHWPTIDRTAK
ncbi:MAG: hypothetical protein H7240_05335 [Glaciimonas sp.]|nr:hypothetical protein [Glaciimonas sp.]